MTAEGTEVLSEVLLLQVHTAGRGGQRQRSSQDHGLALTSESCLFYTPCP